MVIAGDFKIELVEATTKKPFKEHNKDGQTYVEVEPDMEYYISYQRISTQMQEGVKINCLVDCKHLGWERQYNINNIDVRPNYGGSKNWEFDGDQQISEESSLIFAKPTIVQNAGSGMLGPMLMGKIDFQVFELGDLILRPTRSIKSEMSTSARPSLVASASDGKKHVISSVSETSNKESATVSKYIHGKGALLRKITLHYCTVPGLMKAGMLSKPPNVYDYHRAITKSEGEQIKPLLVQPQRICKSIKIASSNGLEFDSHREQKYYDFFDLSTLDDIDDISVGGGVGSSNNSVKKEPSQQATSRISEVRSNKKARCS